MLFGWTFFEDLKITQIGKKTHYTLSICMLKTYHIYFFKSRCQESEETSMNSHFKDLFSIKDTSL